VISLWWCSSGYCVWPKRYPAIGSNVLDLMMSPVGDIVLSIDLFHSDSHRFEDGMPLTGFGLCLIWIGVPF